MLGEKKKRFQHESKVKWLKQTTTKNRLRNMRKKQKQSDKQSSAQGSVFYVKRNASQESQEYVLKIVQKKVLESLQTPDDTKEIFSNHLTTQPIPGFPQLISTKEGPRSESQKLIKVVSSQKIQQANCLQIGDLNRYVHNDLKLENILVGHKDSDIVYLIDFGLTQSYYTEEGIHSEKEYVRKFSGNFLFASLNSCRGNNKSRRDDIESAMYIMIYLLNDNYLPWCDIEKKYEQGMEFKDVLRERLEIEYTKRLFSMIPKELIQTLKNVLTLKFDQEPDYQEIINAISKTKQNYLGHSPSINIATKVQKIIHQENSKFEASERSVDRNNLNFKSKVLASGDNFCVSPARLNNGVVYSSKMFVQLLDSQDLGAKSPINFSSRAKSQLGASNRSVNPMNQFSDVSDKFQNYRMVRNNNDPSDEFKLNLDIPEKYDSRYSNLNNNPSSPLAQIRNRSQSFKKRSQFSKAIPNSQFAKKELRKNGFKGSSGKIENEKESDSLSECKDEDFEQEDIDEVINRKAFRIANLECQQNNIKLQGKSISKNQQNLYNLHVQQAQKYSTQ
ncbi:serine threonine protein kinase [Stylonychia lemnae]|uniref:Casein kinase I n=1 Tax=Stylonychia lemnae TaxID=5949 RepID=A0A078AG03_STYLE|nr:serine threonine protein kinase [Stylonychia lemnae]|eukprot:CDW81235.1 serine threonine protein kinase [Stylonychia lemnae]